MAGHSLGEYTALYACQSLNLADGARLTRIRGQQMQKAVPEGEGTMAAILGLTSTQVVGLCTKAMRKNPKEVVEPANFNAPGQTVIAGTVQGVALAIEILNQDMEYKSGKAIPLKVSAPFHCSLMAPAQNAVSLMLASTKFKKPACPIITNTSAQATTNENTFTSSLIDQIVMPVRWEQSMKNLKTHNVQVMIEVGPGKVLTGLQKRIDPEMVTYNLSTVEQLKGLEA